jgi:hypothetical protein
VLPDLAQRRVDVFDHDALHLESRQELADHGDRVARDELHPEPRTRSAGIVLLVDRDRLIEVHRADRDPADETVEALDAMDLVDQDERDVRQSESPAGPSGRAAVRGRRWSQARPKEALARGREPDLAEDPVVPAQALRWIDHGAPDPFTGRIDRRRESHRDQRLRCPLAREHGVFVARAQW